MAKNTSTQEVEGKEKEYDEENGRNNGPQLHLGFKAAHVPFTFNDE